ncbi:MAG: hypothetical protein U0935_08435 [Pirellulales bacterium]
MRRLAPVLALVLGVVGIGGFSDAGRCADPEEAPPWLVERAAADRDYAERLQKLAARCRELELPAQAELTERWWVPRDPRRQYLYLPRATESSGLPADATVRLQQWHARWLTLRRDRAAALWQLAERAAANGQATLAYQWLCEALHEDPEHAEARRVVGPAAATGKTRPVAASPQVDHPRTGWRRGQYWRTQTEHFQISTNHSAAVALEAAQRLEEFHDVWRQLFFPFWTTPAALDSRLAGSQDPWGPARQHQVVIFRTRDEYLAKLRPSQPQIELTSGYYVDDQRTVFLYAGTEAQRPNWYHEVAHQLFQETLDIPAGVGERGHMWIVEGIATYLESLRRFDGYVTVGGPDAERLQFARYAGLRGAAGMPLSELVSLTRSDLQQHPAIRDIYTRSAGLTHLLMDGAAGRWRPATVRYLAAVYAGRATPDTLASLAGVPLTELDQQYAPFLDVSDADVEFFAAFPLRQLSLGRTSVTPAGLERLAGQEKLEWLDVSFLGVGDDGLSPFRSARRLRQLFLEETRLTDRTLTWVGELRELEELDLAGTQITDDGLQRLTSLKKLRTLYLTRCPITDAGLEQLRALKQLESLDVAETQVTPAGIMRLQRALPRVQIER